jgi:5-methylcytosine-specific restriction endonuclease McrA
MNQGIRQETFERIFKEHLKIETYSKSINSLFSPRLKNKIDYKPYYQRNYVWDYTKATYFIESILLGTEIPPLIFFDNNSEIEIIDGRQRFETILRFMENKFALKPKGLNILTQLKNLSFDDLAKNDREIIEKFLDAKLRIIEFKLVNKPPLDKYLEDRIKKEIFSRYNSGITPLKKAEIDNAIYDDDALSSEIKSYLESNNEVVQKIYNLFFKSKSEINENPPLENIMTFIRRSLVLPLTPITYFAQGTGRTNLLAKLYEKVSDDSVNSEKETLKNILVKIDFIKQVKNQSEINKFNSNRLALECFLWALGILELEEITVDYNSTLAFEIAEFINLNIEDYTEEDYGFIKEVVTRFLKTTEFLQNKFEIDTNVYVKPNDLKKAEIKELLKPNDTATKLSELESLRLNKPEPSRISIDDVVRLMNKRRFLVRPSYQRKEVINPSKASSIIESVLLGITLPALFIFKRLDGISEVIDGQQRLLTLLGFIGSEYIDEKGKSKSSKNHKFSLRKLRILKELESKKFDQLNEEQKNKIYDFPLYLVEIDENQNPQFDPIDLFIRLNDKPYPIRENSFEMWNSWVEVDVIQNIKNLKISIESWFYLKQLSKANDRDRMENEELLTSLIFLEYSVLIKDTRKTLDVYQKTDRLNARIGDKILITNLLMDITEDGNIKKPVFEQALKNTKSFIKKLKYILLDQDKTKDELFTYLKLELDDVFKAEKNPKYFRRTMQDFYFLWYFLSDINFEMVKFYRLDIKREIKNMFNYLKNIPEIDWKENKGMEKFMEETKSFKKKYKIDQRKITLTEKDKLKLIQIQNNESSISGTPIFLGDDIEVDHEFPISKGGKDVIENLRVVHKDENREKGSKV